MYSALFIEVLSSTRLTTISKIQMHNAKQQYCKHKLHATTRVRVNRNTINSKQPGKSKYNYYQVIL